MDSKSNEVLRRLGSGELSFEPDAPHHTQCIEALQAIADEIATGGPPAAKGLMRDGSIAAVQDAFRAMYEARRSGSYLDPIQNLLYECVYIFHMLAQQNKKQPSALAADLSTMLFSAVFDPSFDLGVRQECADILFELMSAFNSHRQGDPIVDVQPGLVRDAALEMERHLSEAGAYTLQYSIVFLMQTAADHQGLYGEECRQGFDALQDKYGAVRQTDTNGNMLFQPRHMINAFNMCAHDSAVYSVQAKAMRAFGSDVSADRLDTVWFDWNREELRFTALGERCIDLHYRSDRPDDVPSDLETLQIESVRDGCSWLHIWLSEERVVELKGSQPDDLAVEGERTVSILLGRQQLAELVARVFPRLPEPLRPCVPASLPSATTSLLGTPRGLSKEQQRQQRKVGITPKIPGGTSTDGARSTMADRERVSAKVSAKVSRSQLTLRAQGPRTSHGETTASAQRAPIAEPSPAAAGRFLLTGTEDETPAADRAADRAALMRKISKTPPIMSSGHSHPKVSSVFPSVCTPIMGQWHSARAGERSESSCDVSEPEAHAKLPVSALDPIPRAPMGVDEDAMDDETQSMAIEPTDEQMDEPMDEPTDAIRAPSEPTEAERLRTTTRAAKIGEKKEEIAESPALAQALIGAVLAGDLPPPTPHR